MFKLNSLMTFLVCLFTVSTQSQSWKTYPYHQQGSVLHFPADEGFHPAEQTEWWYINGHFKGETSGTDYSFMLSYFYHPQIPVDGVRIFSIADETNNWFHSQTLFCDYKNLSQDHLNIEVLPVGGVEEKWITIKDDFGNYKPFEYQIFAANQIGSIDINCVALKRPLMLGENGFIKQGSYGNSYYYSQTMLDVQGILALNGFTEPISGKAWIDHQYGNLLLTVNEQYEWFNIQLSNGMDLNIWNIFKSQNLLPNTPEYKFCSIYLNDFQDTTISDYELTRLKYSYMPNSYNCYSQEWHFVWDKFDLMITTNQKGCEIISPRQFYEGSTSISGWVDNVPVTGVGFAELLHSYQNPKIRFNKVLESEYPTSLLINWELLNPDDGRPILYDLEISNDSGKNFKPITRKLIETFYDWDSSGFDAGYNSVLRVTGYSRDSTLMGSDAVRIGDGESFQGANKNFYLSQNFPNPFNPTTKIKYEIPLGFAASPFSKGGIKRGFVTLKVYNVLGKEVATLVNEEKEAGEYEIEFTSHSGESANGGWNLPSGVYVYKLKVGNLMAVRKMILLR